MPDLGNSVVNKTVCRRLPSSVIAVGIFLFFGATMAALAGATLIWRGTILDRVWTLNPTAYRQLARPGGGIGMLFLLLSGLMVVAGTGWFRLRYWGWCLTIVIVATQVLGDLINVLRGDFLRGGIGFTIAGSLLVYLLSPRVKAMFANCRIK